MMEKPCSCGRLLHVTTRYAPGFISQPALLPHTGKYSFLIHACLPVAHKNHNTATTKLATQENSQGYSKPRLSPRPLTIFLFLAFVV
jgi:hypothetical protein